MASRIPETQHKFNEFIQGVVKYLPVTRTGEPLPRGEMLGHKWILVPTGYPKVSLLPANGMKEYYRIMELITNSANKVFELDERFNHINT